MKKECTYILLLSNKDAIDSSEGDILINEHWGKEAGIRKGIGYPSGKVAHIYIISDEEIKEGDWFLDKDLNGETGLEELFVYQKRIGLQYKDSSAEKKIIATTNHELLAHHFSSDPKVAFSTPYKISPSDIEYIISLYNGKGKEVDVEKLASEEYPYTSSLHLSAGFNKANRSGFIKGYNQCLQDNTDKTRMALCDFHEWIVKDGRIKYNGKPSKQNVVDEFLSSITKEQPKKDIVMVEYENSNSGWQQLSNSGKVGSTFVPDNYIPKLKDGNIVIVK